MNQYVDAFLREVLDKVKYKKMHPYLAQELNDHIELLKEEIMEEEGLSEEAAYERAVAQMGDAKEVGEGLHKMHKPILEWRIILLVGILIGIGTFVLSYYTSQFNDGMQNMALKQGIFAGLASMYVIFIIYKVKYIKAEKLTYFMYGLSVILMVLTLSAGKEVNGVRRWLEVGPILFETCSVTVPLFILSFIGFIRKWGNQGLKGYVKLFVVAEVSIGLCAVQYFAKGIVLLISFIFIVVVYTYTSDFKGNRKRFLSYISIGIATGCIGMVYMIVSVPYRLERIMTFINPQRDPQGEGYILIYLRKVIENAKWVGNSFNIESGYVPLPVESWSELMFSFIIGSMGIISAISIVVIMSLLLIRCFKMAYKVRENYGKLVIYGFSMYFTVQVVMSIAFSLGYLPVGICYLPFISYGGTSLIMDMIMMGFVLCIYRYKDIAPYELLNQKIEVNTKSERNKESLLKQLFCVVADEEFDEEVEDIEDVLSAKPSSLLVKMAMVVLNHSKEVEEINVRFKNR